MKKILDENQQQFIQELSHKMRTQDTRGTAQPYALALREEKIVGGFSDEYADKFGAVWDGELFEDWSLFLDALCDNECDDVFNLIKESGAESFNDLDLLVLGKLGELDISVIGYKKEKTMDAGIGGCNLFLTEDAAIAHIKANRHNLKNPDTYGVHLYRNPEMEKLYEVIHAMADGLKSKDTAATMGVSMNGIRKRLACDFNYLYGRLEDVADDGIKEYMNDLATTIGTFMCLFDDDVDGDFDMIADEVEILAFGEDDEL